MDGYLYKTGSSIFNFDLFLTLVLSIFGFFIHIALGLIMIVLTVFMASSILSVRIFLYKDRIELKNGLFLKTFCKSMPLENAKTVTYSSGLMGKILNYGDVTIGTYNATDGFTLKGVRNAKLLSENIKTLLYEK